MLTYRPSKGNRSFLVAWLYHRNASNSYSQNEIGLLKEVVEGSSEGKTDLMKETFQNFDRCSQDITILETFLKLHVASEITKL